MRKFFTLLWLLFPVAVLYYHSKEGPRQMRLVEVKQDVATIRELTRRQDPDWEQIHAGYDAILSKVSGEKDRPVADQVRLAEATARLDALEFGQAIDELEPLLRDCANRYGEDAHLTRNTRATLGKATYYASLTLKSAGAAEEEWRPFAERARQLFRFLAEHEKAGELRKYEQSVEEQFEKITSRQTPAS